ILGIDRNASAKEISAVFRKLALKWHPDRWSGKPESEKKIAEEKFKEINEAYQVLSDPEKRQNYDHYGSAEGFAQGSSESQFDRGEDFFKDIVNSFFGGGSDYSRQGAYARDRIQPKAGSDSLV